MAWCATRAAAISHKNSALKNPDLQPKPQNSDIAYKQNQMTNGEFGGGDSPEAAKKFLQDIIKRVHGLYAIVITDRDGIPVVKVNVAETPDVVCKPNFLASVSLAVEQAGKLGSGKNRRIICMFNSFQVVHFNKTPLMISLVANGKANTGLLLNLENELNDFVEDLQTAINASNH